MHTRRLWTTLQGKGIWNRKLSRMSWGGPVRVSLCVLFWISPHVPMPAASVYRQKVEEIAQRHGYRPTAEQLRTILPLALRPKIRVGSLRVHISYFNPHSASWGQATISWFKPRKCGVFSSAFFFSTSWAEVSGAIVWIKGCNPQFRFSLVGLYYSSFSKFLDEAVYSDCGSRGVAFR